MIVRNAQGEYIGLACDTCEAPAPPADEIMKGHGLNRMGWHCTGGVHLCPDHNPQREEHAA